MQQNGTRAQASGSRQLSDDYEDLDEENDTDSFLGEFSASPSTPGTAPGKKRKLSVELQILKTLEKSQKDLEASMTEVCSCSLKVLNASSFRFVSFHFFVSGDGRKRRVR